MAVKLRVKFERLVRSVSQLLLGLLVIAPCMVMADEVLMSTAVTAVASKKRASITRYQVDVSAAPARYRAKAKQTLIESIELRRFDLNDAGELSRKSIAQVGKAVRQYIDVIKLDRARGQAEFDARFKDEIITFDLLTRIAESAFVYRARIVNLNVSRQVSIGGIILGSSSGSEVPAWGANVEAKVDFWRVNFSTGEMEKVETLRVRTSGVATEAIQSRQSAKDSAVDSALSNMVRDLRTAVRGIDEFSLSANVRRATWNSVWFEGTEEDGVHVDSIYRVSEVGSDGQKIERGWAQVRSLADVEEGETESRAQVIAVRNGFRLEGGELLTEHPRKGIVLQFGGGAYPVDAKGGPALGPDYDASFAGFGSLSLLWNLAEATNLSDLYVGVNLQLGFAGPYFNLDVAPAVEKIWQVRRWMFGVRAAAGVHFVLFSDPASSYRAIGVGVRPVATTGIWLTPSLQIMVEGGYRAYTTLNGATDSDDNERFVDEFIYNSSGPTVGLSLRLYR